MPSEDERKISTYETYVTTPSERTVLLIRPRSDTWADRIGVKEVTTLNFWRCVLTEFVLSLFFIMFACGSAYDDSIGNLQQAISVGFLVAVLVSVSSDHSGVFNPAITFGLLLSRKLKYTRFFLYVVAQIAGSLAGAGLMYMYIPSSIRGDLGTLKLHSDISDGKGFLIEMTLTFLLVWNVLAVTDQEKGYNGFQKPLSIGYTVTATMLLGIPFTGAAMNPIRAFGPGVVMNRLDNHWIYWVGPLVGALLASLSYEYVFKLGKEKQEKSEMKPVQLHINTNSNTSL